MAEIKVAVEAKGLVLADPLQAAEVRVPYVELHTCENCGSPALCSSLRLSDLKRSFHCLVCQPNAFEGTSQ